MHLKCHFSILAIFFLSLSLHAKPLVYCSEGSPSSFNPQLVTDGTSINASAHPLFNRLVEFEYGTTKIIPSLAESWSISKDQLIYTFKLRKNVKFHQTKNFTPSRNFNAQDVLFSIERQMKKDHPYHQIGGGIYEYFDGMEMGKIIKSIKIVDDYTVAIELTRPEAPFLANMAMPFMSIHSSEYADFLAKKNQKELIDSNPVGTGPFIFSSYVKDNIIRYDENKNYWSKKGNVDKLIFAITPDASVRFQKLKTNECQIITEPAPQDLAQLKSNPQIQVMQAAGLNVGYLAINTTKKPFDQLNVRKAIQLALNRANYIQTIYLGNAQVAKNPMPPTIWSYNENIKDYSYNPKEAKELLSKAGFPNGFETTLWVLPVARPYLPNGKKMGELMQADLAQIGIKVKIQTFDWPTYLAKSKTGEHSLIQFGWTGDNGDPDNFLNTLLSCSSVSSGSNYARWCHKEFNDLVEKARTVTKTSERTKLYMKAQEIFKREIPWVPLAHSQVFRAMTKNVSGYKIDPLGADIFNHVVIK